MNNTVYNFLKTLDASYTKNSIFFLVKKTNILVALCVVLRKEGFIMGYDFYNSGNGFIYIKVYLTGWYYRNLTYKLNVVGSALSTRSFNGKSKPYRYIKINSSDHKLFTYFISYLDMKKRLDLSFCCIISTDIGYISCSSVDDIFFRMCKGGVLICCFFY